MVAGMDATRVDHSVEFSKVGYVALGSPSGNQMSEIQRVAEFLDAVHISYEIPEDIIKEMWWKYILNIGINQTSALLKLPYRLFQTSAYGEKIMRMTMQEAYEVARKIGVNITQADLERCMTIINTLSPDGKTSMCQDIEGKRPTEVDMFAGTLIELGKKHGVPVPINTFLYNAIKAMESQY